MTTLTYVALGGGTHAGLLPNFYFRELVDFLRPEIN